MLADLSALFAAVPVTAKPEEYERAIIDGNVLAKPTGSTRLWAWKKLRELYGLDPQIPLFRYMRQIWDVDPTGRPLLTVLEALARDALLRASAQTIIRTSPGELVARESFIEDIV